MSCFGTRVSQSSAANGSVRHLPDCHNVLLKGTEKDIRIERLGVIFLRDRQFMTSHIVGLAFMLILHTHVGLSLISRLLLSAPFLFYPSLGSSIFYFNKKLKIIQRWDYFGRLTL